MIREPLLYDHQTFEKKTDALLFYRKEKQPITWDAKEQRTKKEPKDDEKESEAG